MAASANASRTIQINLEKQYINLEGQLSWKNKALDSATDKLQTAEENVALVIAEKDRQSANLISFQKANEDLKAQLWDFDKIMMESKSKCRVAEEKVGYYESVEYTAKVVDIYKSSSKFE